jgi:hypothetical protein
LKEESEEEEQCPRHHSVYVHVFFSVELIHVAKFTQSASVQNQNRLEPVLCVNICKDTVFVELCITHTVCFVFPVCDIIATVLRHRYSTSKQNVRDDEKDDHPGKYSKEPSEFGDHIVDHLGKKY